VADITRILCPVDLSELSRHALDHARAIAGWYGARITVLHVYGPQEIPAFTTDVPATATLPVPIDPLDLQEQVRRFCDGGPANAIGLDILVEEGSPAKVIVRAAKDIEADLLVLATHGRSGFDRFVLGSVTEKVLRTTPVPVLTVPPPATSGAQPLYKRILCAMDFSDASTRALELALSLAREADARLTLLHVVEEVPVVAAAPEAVPFSLPDYQRRLHEDARRRLDDALPEEARIWCTPDVQITTGKPYREILRMADEAGTELVVMGVQGRGALNRWLFGSTTSQVIRHATCPVLTVRE
jgi:nucleotide-binding universal stress UspA family protein